MKGIRETTSALIGLWLLAEPATAGAWSFQGHEIVGAVADGLLGGTRAAAAVYSLLGDTDFCERKKIDFS